MTQRGRTRCCTGPDHLVRIVLLAGLSLPLTGVAAGSVSLVVRPQEASVDEVKLLEWFRQVLNSDYGLRKDVVTPKADFLTDLGLDSLDQMNLMFDIENEFDIQIFMGEETDLASYDRVRTVGDAMQFIASRLK